MEVRREEGVGEWRDSTGATCGAVYGCMGTSRDVKVETRERIIGFATTRCFGIAAPDNVGSQPPMI